MSVIFAYYDDFKNYICDRISSLRSKKDVSAREMSLKIGQGQNYINTIENKKNLPSMEGFYYICWYLNISPKDFFDQENQNPEILKLLIEDLKSLSDEQLLNLSALVKDLKK